MAARKLKPRAAKTINPNNFELIVTAERWRFYAYLAFWGMCIFAMTITKTYVEPFLEEGPADGSTCPPFNSNAPEIGVIPGKGFDLKTQSHLVQTFGYNNICSNWDYSPSRELTAMFYPLFEYSVIIYLFLDFVVTILANQRGELNGWFWGFSKVILPINLFLCSQFRMIFVCLAYVSVRQHTAAFVGLQISLILIAIQNSLFIWDTNIAYEELGGPQNGLRNTRIAVVLYLIGDLIVSALKLSVGFSFVAHGIAADWIMKDSLVPGMKVGQVLDILWMIFNAVLPVLISYFRSKHEEPIKIVFSQKEGIYIGGDNDDIITEETHLTIKK